MFRSAGLDDYTLRFLDRSLYSTERNDVVVRLGSMSLRIGNVFAGASKANFLASLIAELTFARYILIIIETFEGGEPTTARDTSPRRGNQAAVIAVRFLLLYDNIPTLTHYHVSRSTKSA